MRGIQSTWGDPDIFPELLSVTKDDPNNFCVSAVQFGRIYPPVSLPKPASLPYKYFYCRWYLFYSTTEIILILVQKH